MGTGEKEEGLDFQYTFQGCPHQCISHLPPVHWGRLCLRAKCSSVTPDYPPSQEQKCGSADEWINPSRTSRKLSITDIKTAMSRAGTAAQLAECLLITSTVETGCAGACL